MKVRLDPPPTSRSWACVEWVVVFLHPSPNIASHVLGGTHIMIKMSTGMNGLRVVEKAKTQPNGRGHGDARGGRGRLRGGATASGGEGQGTGLSCLHTRMHAMHLEALNSVYFTHISHHPCRYIIATTFSKPYQLKPSSLSRANV